MYDDVEAFCLFMGYTRSGHSLVGTLLDAHPEAMIAHEGKLFAWREGESITGELRKLTREKLLAYLVDRSARQGRQGFRGRRRGEHVDNLVAGASNGVFTTLRVVGNKRGQEPPMAWDRNPGVFDELAQIAGTEVRLVHVYRNPWDNIASMSRRHGERALGRYFRRVAIIHRFKSESAVAMHDLALEDLIADPRKQVRRLVGFFGLSADDAYLEACAAAVDASVTASRNEYAWTPREIRGVCRRMEGIPWLERYPRTPLEESDEPEPAPEPEPEPEQAAVVAPEAPRRRRVRPGRAARKAERKAAKKAVLAEA